MAKSGPLSPAQAATLLLSAMDGGKNVACLAVTSHPLPNMLGARILFLDGERVGSLGDPEADSAGADLARAGLAGDPDVLTGLHSISLRRGKACQVYLELHHPQPELVIVGAGHLAQPLSTMGSILGLRVRVLDDRPQFATRERFPDADEIRAVDFGDPFSDIPLHPWSHLVLVTRGHRYDYQCLRKVLEHSPLPGYIGMIGSRRRVRATFDALLEEGFDRELLTHVRAPIGLDLGGETPAEIAISVAAEIVLHWNGGSGRPLREQERILDRFHPVGPEGAPVVGPSKEVGSGPPDPGTEEDV